MKKRNKILIMLASITLLSVFIGVVLAAYTFRKTIKNEEAEVGQITVNEKKFISYQDSTKKNLRIDTVCRLDDFVLTSAITYNPATGLFASGIAYYVAGTYEKQVITIGEVITANTYYTDTNGAFVYASGTFQNGVTYYKKTDNSGYTQTETVSIGSPIGGGYFEKVVSYTGVNKVNTALSLTSDELDVEISDEGTGAGKVNNVLTVKENTTTLCVITLTGFNNTTGILGGTVTADEDSDYSLIVDPDYMGLVVINNAITGTALENANITCSASPIQEEGEDNIYLNQLGLQFTFTNEIAVYVRIHIQDAWVVTRVYSSNRKESYSIKDQISGNSPFTVTDPNWYYDASSNTAYLKTMVMPEKNEDGTYKSQTHLFNVNQAYFYIGNTNTTVYTEYMTVEVSFTVDLVQANRALDLWKIDPSTLGN